MPKLDKYDCIIIGGGFFGAYIALQLKEKYNSILVLEQESDLLLHASLNNQARVHNGYHYPRSLSTAVSSSRHFKTFCNEFKSAIKMILLNIMRLQISAQRLLARSFTDFLSNLIFL